MMQRRQIEQMLSGIEDKYIAEALKTKKKKAFVRGRNIAAAILLFFAVFGTAVSVAAAVSDAFGEWIERSFLGTRVTKVDMMPKETAVSSKADIPADENGHLILEEDTTILGEKESFVCRYHREGDDEVTDKVYSVWDNGLIEMKPQSFRGKYAGGDFSFEYVIINKEILAFNTAGNICEVFHYVDGDTVYADLWKVRDGHIKKGCIARLNLKTGEVVKLTNDKTIGNMKMSPNGKLILINYRKDGYWTVFNPVDCSQKRIDEIYGYAHTHEIKFKGDYQVLTLGDDYMEGDTTMTGTKIIDLRTGKRVVSYQAVGTYWDPEWIYEQKGETYKIKNVDGTTAITIPSVKGFPHPLSSGGDYVLLGDEDERDSPYYLCNLKQKTYTAMDSYPAWGEDVGFYFAAKEGKALLTDGKDAYLVDINI